MSVTKVLIADHEYATAHILQSLLVPDIRHVEVAISRDEVLHRLPTRDFDLVLLVYSDADSSAHHLCQEIHRTAEIPILLVFEPHHSPSIRHALRCGGNDFIVRPFDKETLLARVEVIWNQVRPLHLRNDMPSGTNIFEDDYLQIDLTRRRIITNGRRANLTPTEYEILACLLRHADQVLTYDQIIEQVWGWQRSMSRSALHTYMSHLRGKVEEDPEHPRYLHTEYGIGYHFAS